MATVYVAPSPTGDDSRTYTQAQSSATPWATIGKCNTSATTGDTIVLLAGTHTWATVAFTKSFTIQGNTSDPTLYILDGGASAVRWSGLLTLTVSNVTFQNANGGGTTTEELTIFQKANADSNALTFTNCIFKTIQIKNDTVGGGLFGVRNNHNNGALVLNLTRCQISVTKSASNVTSALALIMARITVNSVITVNSCTIALLGTSGASTQIDNLHNFISTATNLTLTYKNTIIYCPTTAVTWATGTAATTTTATYCDFYQVTSSPSGTGTITSDPLFVDAANGNFNLRPTSPCLNTGTLV